MLRDLLPEEDWDDGHLAETPERLAKLLIDMTTPEQFNFTVFDNTEMIDQMVCVSNIPFYSLCRHHVVPYFGVAHVAYIPAQKICGISKLARAVHYHAKGLTVQEHLTNDIGDDLENKLAPKGVAVVMEAEHLCMTMRGVKAAGTSTETSYMQGVFLDPEKQARQEFFELVRSKR
jgi:GTP cyclohydrolase I